MRYRLETADAVIGESDLENVDDGMGIAWGRFAPTPEYARVKHIFRMYAEAVPETSAGLIDESLLQRFYDARDALGLKVTDQQGNQVPTSSIHVYDFTREAGADALQLDVVVSDRLWWNAWRSTS